MRAQAYFTVRSIAVLLSGFVLTMMLLSNSWASASARPLPKDGVLGVLSLSSMPAIVIDDQPRKMSASGQIRNEKNLIVQTSTLSGKQDVNILYKQNKLGQIDRIWILTDAEYTRIRNGDPAPLPTALPPPVQK
jgi:hypothetical protein